MPFSPEQIQQAVAQATQPKQQPQQQPVEDNSVGIAPYLAAIGGQGADLASSLYKTQHGYGEANFGGSMAAMIATKLALAGGMPFLMHHLANSGHPSAAKAIGYITGAGGAIPAAYNMSQPNLK